MEAHVNTRHTFAFIEDEQGNGVSDTTLKAIWKTIQGCWAELVVKAMAPKSWGKANTSTKELVYSLTYRAFLFLQLAENNWKIDLLCSLDYPGWVHNNLDDQGNWLATRKIKQEKQTMAINIDEPVTSANKKHKGKTLNSKVANKKFKGQLGFFLFWWTNLLLDQQMIRPRSYHQLYQQPCY